MTALCLLLGTDAGAQSRAVLAEDSPTAPHKPLPTVTLQRPITTHHQGTFNGKVVAYTATVEPIDVQDAQGKPSARLVVISYTADLPAPGRPVVFAFNGGPISDSGTIHMGFLGPKRLAVPDDIKADPATFKVVENTYSLLDVADLVFFDPAETGYSRVAPGVDFNTALTSVATDAQELTSLVPRWCAQHGRTGAPKYLIGESYGTVRAAEAASQLLKAGVPLAGVVLLGQAVNIIEYSQRPDNIVSYAVSLPTLAAIGWYHGKAQRKGRTFDQFMQDAQDYANGEYLSVLFLGQRVPLTRRQAVAHKLEELTGLSADFYLEHNLKVSKVLYQRSLFPQDMLNTNDARYVRVRNGPDPFAQVLSTLQDRYLAYLREDLKVGDIGEFARKNPAPAGLNGWDWGPNKSPFGDWPYVQSLTEVFNAVPGFRLMVADGYYDTQTTVGAQDYLLGDAYWPAERALSRHYQGGHMAYTVEATAKQMSEDIRGMITGQPW